MKEEKKEENKLHETTFFNRKDLEEINKKNKKERKCFFKKIFCKRK